MSKKDIEDAGGRCEYIATDFWECTDKDGKVWWCSNGGKDCVAKPLRAPRLGREQYHTSGGVVMAENCQECQKKGRGRGTDPRAIAVRALKLLASLPDEYTCARNFPKSTANFLSAARDFAADCAMAHTWTEEEARTRFDALKLSDAGSTYVSELQPPGGGGGESDSARCNREKDECNDRCHSSNGGYFCFFDCRLTYIACLAGTITHIGGSGGLTPA